MFFQKKPVNSDKELILHIGTHKTGSTAIQHLLKTHAEVIRGKGIMAATLQWDLKPVHDAFLPLFKESDRNNERILHAKEVFQKLIKDVAEPRVLLSSESMTTFRTPWKISAKIARQIFGDMQNITIIVYVRRQDRAFESYYQTLVKRGAIKGADGSVAHFQKFCQDPVYGVYNLDWYKGIEDYHKIFPQARFIVRCYELAVTQGDIGRDFLTNIGITDLPEDVCSGRMNPGLNDVGLTIMASTRPVLSQDDADTLALLLTHKYSAVRSSSIKGYGFFTREQREEIVQRYHDSNASLFEKYNIGLMQELLQWEYVEDEKDNASEDPKTDAIQHLSAALLSSEKAFKDLHARHQQMIKQNKVNS